MRKSLAIAFLTACGLCARATGVSNETELNAALSAASAGDVIEINTDARIQLSTALMLSKSVALSCPNGQATLVGSGTDRVVYVNATGVSLTNIVMTGGTTTSSGGGLYSNSKANLTLSGCVFSNNVAVTQGGGAYIYGNSVLKNCLFLGNSTTSLADGNGGGNLFVSSGSASITDCEFFNGTSPTNASGYNYGGGAPSRSRQRLLFFPVACSQTMSQVTAGRFAYAVEPRSLPIAHSSAIAPKHSGAHTMVPGYLSIVLSKATRPSSRSRQMVEAHCGRSAQSRRGVCSRTIKC